MNTARLALAVAVMLCAEATRALSAEPAAPPPADARRAEAAERFDRGMALLEDGDNAGALAELVRVQELAPHPRVLFNIGLIYAAMNRPVDATRTFDQLLGAPGALPEESLRLARRTRDAEARRVARLDVTTNVPATIEADGIEVGKTPLDGPLAVAAGTRVVAASSPGYLPVRREITVAGETTTALHLELAPSELRLAHLAIRANIADVDVFVDGERVGRTPLSGSLAVPPGRRGVEARRAGYRSARREIALDDGATGELSFDLVEDEAGGGAGARRGQLVLAVSEPDPDVTVDGQPRGAYRGPLSLPPGVHQIRIARAGFLPAERTVLVPEAGDASVKVTLVPTPETREAYKSNARLRRTLGWVGTLGGGVLAIGAGLLVALNRGPLERAQKNIDDILARDPCLRAKTDSSYEPACRAELDPADDRFNTRQNIQNAGLVALGVGVVAAGVGAVLLLTTGDPYRYDHAPHELDTPAKLALDGWLGQGGGGFSLAGRF